MKWSDDSFVDLYQLLDVWPDAETGAVRKRIAELYLEARENLEHQNHRKRFYYRELYEVQLPGARTILLDPQKRRDYDNELQTFWKHKGKPSPPHQPREAPRAKPVTVPGTTLEDEFAEFADVEDDALPPFQLPQPVLDKTTQERRRDTKRRELIKHELVATGARWAAIGGLTAFLIAGGITLILFKLLNLNSPNLIIFAAASVITASVIGGRQTMRWAKRRIIGVLSKLPYDELLRHCISR